MIRPPRPKLWHLSALVLVSALAMALAREASASGGLARFGGLFALVGAVAYLGSVYVGAKLAEDVSGRLIERGRAAEGPAGRALVILGGLAYFVVTLGMAGLGLATIVAALVVLSRLH